MQREVKCGRLIHNERECCLLCHLEPFFPNFERISSTGNFLENVLACLLRCKGALRACLGILRFNQFHLRAAEPARAILKLDQHGFASTLKRMFIFKSMKVFPRK